MQLLHHGNANGHQTLSRLFRRRDRHTLLHNFRRAHLEIQSHHSWR